MIAKKRLFTSLSWSFVDQFLTYGISFVIQIIIARILSPSDFGAIAVVLVFVNIANALALSGFSSALIQKSNVESEDFDTAFWIAEGFAVVLYFIIYVVAHFAAEVYEIGELALYIRTYSLVLFLNTFSSIKKAQMQREFDFKSLCIVGLISSLASGVTGVVLALLEFGVWALIVQALVSGIISSFLFLIVGTWRPNFNFRAESSKFLFKFGWKMSATSLVNSAGDSIVDLLIGKYLNVADLGFYTQGKRYAIVAATLLQNPISNVLFPTFSRLQDNVSELRSLMKKGLQVGSYFLVPVLFLFAVVAEPLVCILLTDKWLASVPVLQSFCLMYSFLLIETMNLRLIVSLGRTDLYLKLHVLRALLAVLVCVTAALITRNLYAIAFCYSLFQSLYILFVVAHPAKYMCGYSASDQLRDIGLVYLAAIFADLFAAAILIFLNNQFQKLIIGALVFTLVYIVASAALRLPGFEFVAREFRNLNNKIRNTNKHSNS